MRDLSEAIQAVLSNCIPVNVGSVHAGYYINKEDLNVLCAEFNIHFVEPDDNQFRIEGKPLNCINIDMSNVQTLSYDQDVNKT